MNRKTKRTPKGIAAGFAYNPGKAWLEPKTVAPLPAEYRAVLEARGQTWPTGFCDTATPEAPAPRNVAPVDLLPAGTTPAVAARCFTNTFLH